MQTDDEGDLLPIVFVGRGIFGVYGALETAKRLNGKRRIICLGRPNKEASTVDVSKITRGDYGDDELYTKLHALAFERWQVLERKWGMRQSESGLESLFHWTGVYIVSRESHPMPETSYESCSLRTLKKVLPHVSKDVYLLKGEEDIRNKLNPVIGTFKSGYYNPLGGWIESGLVLERLVKEAEAVGVQFLDQDCVKISERTLVLEDGRVLRASKVVVAAGAWTPFLLPQTTSLLEANLQPVFLFKPKKDEVAEAWYSHGEGGKMGPTTLDIAQTGHYTFPFHKRAGVLKMGYHGSGIPVKKPLTRADFRKIEEMVLEPENARMSKFLNEISPNFLNEWSLDTFRLCQYCDSRDSHFLIDELEPGLIVATGGSGHGFKFGPILGELIADRVLGVQDPSETKTQAAARFAWRTIDPESQVFEKARHSSGPVLVSLDDNQERPSLDAKL